MQKAVDEGVVRALRNGVELADSIRSSAKVIVTALQNHFDHSGYKESGVSFAPTDGRHVIGAISTPFVQGRLALSMRLVNGLVVGMLLVQRERLDERDTSCWQTVSRIIVPGVSAPYIETPHGQHEIEAHATFADDNWCSLHTAGMLIVSALLVDSQ